MALKELEGRYATKRAKDYKLARLGGAVPPRSAERLEVLHMKYRFDGKEKLLSFGAYPSTTLADTRLRRAGAKAALGQGRGPGARKLSALEMTFEGAARTWHAHRLAALGACHAARLLTRLARNAFPAIGKTDLTATQAAQ